MVFQDTIELAAQERGATDITDLISAIIRDSGIKIGSCQLFVHNSLSCLLINDTADENTRQHTVDFMAQLVPDCGSMTSVIDESMDAIPEQMRNAITQTSITFPVSRGRPLLGTWQGIYLWERTTQPKPRKLTITIIGE